MCLGLLWICRICGGLGLPELQMKRLGCLMSMKGGRAILARYLVFRSNETTVLARKLSWTELNDLTSACILWRVKIKSYHTFEFVWIRASVGGIHSSYMASAVWHNFWHNCYSLLLCKTLSNPSIHMLYNMFPLWQIYITQPLKVCLQVLADLFFLMHAAQL